MVVEVGIEETDCVEWYLGLKVVERNLIWL